MSIEKIHPVSREDLHDGIIVAKGSEHNTFCVVSVYGLDGKRDELPQLLKSRLSCIEAARHAQDMYRHNVVCEGTVDFVGGSGPEDSYYERLGLIERVIKVSGFNGDAHHKACEIERTLDVNGWRLRDHKDSDLDDEIPL